MSAPDIVELARVVVEAAADVARAQEETITARESLKRFEQRQNRLEVDLANARAALNKALDS